MSSEAPRNVSRRTLLKLVATGASGAAVGGSTSYLTTEVPGLIQRASALRGDIEGLRRDLEEARRLREQALKLGFGLEPQVRIFQWYDYIAPGIVDAQQSSFGVNIGYSIFGSLEAGLSTLLNTRGEGIDVNGMCTDFVVPELVRQGLLQPLDMERLPNFRAIQRQPLDFQNPWYDPGPTKYTVPYEWGTTGIGYWASGPFALDGSTQRLIEDSNNQWDVLFDERVLARYPRRISILDEAREAFAAALVHLGYDMNDENEDHIKQAFDELRRISPFVRVDAQGVKENLISGSYVIAHGFNTDIYLALFATFIGTAPYIKYVMPRPQATVWTDNLSILKQQTGTSPKNINSAYWWINNMLAPPNEAVNVNYLFVACPSEVANSRYALSLNSRIYPWIYNFKEIGYDILGDPNLYPDAETMKRLSQIREYQNQRTKQLVSELWLAFKAALPR